jgi:hypothetical protein
MTEPREPSALFETSANTVAALTAAILGALVVWGLRDFALDDAWIHLSYAKSVRLGDGWSYNPGDHEAGITSPLWVALLVVWPTAGDPVMPVLLLGALLHALAGWTASALAIAIGRQQATIAAPLPLRSIALLAGMFTASAPLLLHGIGSGMEVPLTAALALALAWVTIEGHPRAALALGALGLFARPELGAFAAALAGLAVLARRRLSSDTVRAAVLGFVGACAAAVVWGTWLLATVGAPAPNGWFVKGGGSTSGLAYLGNEVLLWQPWLVGVGPLLLAAWALRREWMKGGAQVTVVVGASVATIVAIALSRPFHAGVQFFEARYFAPFVAIPVLAVAFGVANMQRWLAVLLVLPGIALTSRQVGETLGRIHAAADDTRVLHTQVARFVAANLPSDAIVAVEGAGALRYHTPRSMTIVDLVGLNDHVAARLHFDRTAKQCHWVARAPTHAVVPIDFVPHLGGAFDLAPLAAFDDATYTQVEPHRAQRIFVVALRARPEWSSCAPR